jgi:large subunit ribosomal protein L7e
LDKKERVEKRKTLVANSEKYYNEYKSTAAGIVKAKREAKAAGNYFVPAEAKVAFAIRTRG